MADVELEAVAGVDVLSVVDVPEVVGMGKGILACVTVSIIP